MNLKAHIARSFLLALAVSSVVCAQPAATGESKNAVAKVWVADNGDGTYKNPVIHADYSDPDVSYSLSSA